MELECRAIPPDATRCVDPRGLEGAYSYLLGIYLGDGMLSQAAKHVWRLRVFQDRRYREIIARIRWAMTEVSGNRSSLMLYVGHIEIFSHWKHWLCLFPQHGPGVKHRRRIRLEPWQRALIRAYPHEFIRGLIHSDGCRAMNKVKRPTLAGIRHYAYVRYFFTNASADIRALFIEACSWIRVDCRPTTERVLSVAHRKSVARLEAFIGPKR